MGGLPSDNPGAFICSILGIVISVTLYLTPLPTFYGVYVNGWDEGLTPVPYTISLFNCILRIYYALIMNSSSSGGYLVFLIVNIIGFTLSTSYITICFIYAPNQAKVYTTILIMLLDVAMFAPILLITLLLWKGEERIDILSWIYLVCLTITAAVSPLSTIYRVIQTRSLKCMPFYDPFLTTLGASAWLANAILIKNIEIAVTNAVSLMFGLIQMLIYMKYKDADIEVPGAGEVGN